MRRLAFLVACVASAQIPNPDLDLGSLGHVVVAGRFSGISLVNNTQSTEISSSATSDGLFAQAQDGSYSTLGESNGIINAVCSLNNTRGTIYVGGNFTTIGGVAAANIASYSPASNAFAPLSTGVLGTVNALYCDNTNNQVYIGGEFDKSNSSNAVIWSVSDQRFNNVPFGGFDGPVRTIQPSSSSILFGGRFDTLANDTSSAANNPQQINLQTATITAESTSNTQGFNNPRNIVCPSGQDTTGSSWLLSDNQAGSWSANFNYTIRPTKFRMYNTHIGGRGTREFRFIYQPTGGILNLTYIDPATNTRAYCDSVCPLTASTSVDFVEYQFVNVIEMSGFTVAVSGWYGLGGGLRGFQIFREDIFAYAVDAYNEPTCANGSFLSTSNIAGPWTSVAPPGANGYLSANLSGAALSTSSVSLYPQVSERGTYSVRLYTPGCLADNTCNVRGAVLVSVYPAPGQSYNSTIFQTNNYEKYDTIYQGPVTPSSASFRPHVILTPMSGQSGTINTVASRVQFLELSASGNNNLNGLYEFSPSSYTSSSTANTTIDRVGTSLNLDAMVNVIVSSGSKTFIAGNFSSNGIANILVLDGSASPLARAGLNGAVATMLVSGSVLYIGGNFTALVNSTVSAKSVVGYNITSDSFIAIGSGSNSPVLHIFQDGPLIGISSTTATSFWDPVHQRFATTATLINGSVRNSLLSNGTLFLAGDIMSTAQSRAPGLASLYSNGQVARIAPLDLSASYDVYAGTFYNSSTKSLSIVGGNFSSGAAVIANNTLTALALPNNSIVQAIHVDGQRAYLGGSIAGTLGSSTVGGIVIYDVESSQFDATQPAALQGSNVQVNSITTRPGVGQIVVAGSFDSAGSLVCPTLCVLDRASTTWQRPATGLSGTVSSSTWLGQNILLLAGNMVLNGTTHYVATFDFTTQTFKTLNANLPGPARIAVSDTNQTDSIYVAGQASNAYLAKINGNTTVDLSSGLLPGSQIYDLQFVPLTKRVSSNSVMESNRNLLVLGSLNLSTRNVSAALFDGATYTPFLTTISNSSSTGIIRTLFSEQLTSFSSRSGKLSRGVVIVIALAIAFFIVFTIVALGILMAYMSRRREGYRPASQVMPEKLPPSNLYGDGDAMRMHSDSPKI